MLLNLRDCYEAFPNRRQHEAKNGFKTAVLGGANLQINTLNISRRVVLVCVFFIGRVLCVLITNIFRLKISSSIVHDHFKSRKLQLTLLLLQMKLA
ncbi:hypothetical protein QE152_g4332 [Popillia japonica]|uniref:Uncharacterized protein n=1 Tax=Popillia japonica TaxID=7064 RepID=A0AAW1N1F0_POPJA